MHYLGFQAQLLSLSPHKNTTMKTNFYSLILLVLIKICYSQNLGDYRTIASGNWEDTSNWQIFTASGWTATNQFPGQTNGNYTVNINDTHTITVGNYTNGNNSGPTLTKSYNIGNLNILGQLTLNINLELNNTSHLTLDAGTVLWNQNNVYLKLKQNAEVKIINTGNNTCTSSNGINGFGFIGGNCSNQTSLIIGSITYTNCAGSGNSIAGTFCDVNQAGGTMDATPVASSTSICYNANINNSVTLTANSNSNISEPKTYTWYLDSFPSNFSGFSSQNSQTLTINNLIPGTYTFRLKISITKSGITYSAEGQVTITVYQPITPGKLNDINYCSKYSSIKTLTLSEYYGNIIKWQTSTDKNFLNNVNDISNNTNTLTIDNITDQEQYYRAVLTNGSCSGYSAVATVKNTFTTYNGNWSNGLPDLTKKAIFFNSYTLASDLNACSIEIKNNAEITIPTGKNLTIDGEIELNSGNIIVETDANLIQINEYSKNLGNILVKRKATLKRLDYNNWSAPVSGQNLRNFSSNTLENRFYVHNESNGYYDGIFVKNLYPNNSVSLTPLEDKNTYIFEKGKGYVIRSPNNYTTNFTTFDWTFTGNPNNGIIEVPIHKDNQGLNLIGNPYPSNISFEAFYQENSNLIEPIAYFWTNTNPNPTMMQGASYDGSNYAIRNLTDGVPAYNQDISERPTDAITIGQGFIIRKTNLGNSNLTFNNRMRTPNKGRFFNARTMNVESHKYWLKLITPAKNFNTILIGYVKGATNGIDKGYDTEGIQKSSDMFYSVLEDKKLLIQGLSNTFSTNDKIQLGGIFYEPGNYEISLAQVEGVFKNNQKIYLKDKQTNTVANLSESSYKFYSKSGEINDRFEIVYKTDGTLSSVDINSNRNTLIYEQLEDIIIENKAEKIISYQVFDASGKLLYSTKLNQNKAAINKNRFQKGVVFFSVKLNDKTFTKSFLIK